MVKKTKILKLRIKGKKTKKKKKPKKNSIQNIGGWLLHPPKTCTKRKISNDGTIWTDLSICHYCENKCKEYITFIKMKTKDRNRWLSDNGVNIDLNVSTKVKYKNK